MKKESFIEVAMRNAEEKINQLESQNESLKKRCAELERELTKLYLFFRKPCYNCEGTGKMSFNTAMQCHICKGIGTLIILPVESPTTGT